MTESSSLEGLMGWRRKTVKEKNLSTHPTKSKQSKGTNEVISETWKCFEESKMGLEIESAWADCLA